ncbi:MAG: rhodanese-like domain-containing protein [Candidatus Saccharibacteria bacterium]
MSIWEKAFLFTLVVIGIIGILMALYLLVIAPSIVGKAGPEGQRLKIYVEPSKLKKLINEGREDIWIIDVRPINDYEEGHIPGAKSFPYSTIETRLEELPGDKYLILYCRTGIRVELTINSLKKHGYTKYLNWGGYTRWPYELETDN